jgi:hypothetical protein
MWDSQSSMGPLWGRFSAGSCRVRKFAPGPKSRLKGGGRQDFLRHEDTRIFQAAQGVQPFEPASGKSRLCPQIALYENGEPSTTVLKRGAIFLDPGSANWKNITRLSAETTTFSGQVFRLLRRGVPQGHFGRRQNRRVFDIHTTSC